MRIREYTIPKILNFDTLYYPSFALPLLDISENGRRAIKRWGICKGLLIELVDRENVYSARVVHHDELCLDYAEYLLGLWIDPAKHIHEVGSELREIVELLIEGYEGIGIATSPRDDVELFASIALSRNTDYHRNVVKWMKNMLQLYESIDRVVEVSIDELRTRVGTSYQILQLPSILRMYLEHRDKLLVESSESVRETIMSWRFLGPKVADAYLLFVKLDPRYAPIDVNLVEFVKRIGIDRYLGTEPPIKSFCLRYDCSSCPKRDACLSYGMRRSFGYLAGWVQTIAWIHTKVFCRRNRCETCILRKVCRYAKS